VLREIVQKGDLNSTQAIEIGVGMPEKEMGKGKGTGTGTVETRLVGCSCWARWCRFGKAVLEGKMVDCRRPEGLYHGGGMRDGGEGYTNLAWGRSKLCLERGGYL
jgi:hypothetical protein